MAPFALSRSIRVNAPASVILTHLDSFAAWQDWSPWEKLDPNLQREFSGPERGVGARYAWSGNGKAGSGEMEILEETPSDLRVRLSFIKPFKAENLTHFALAPAGDGATDVTWTMTGERGRVAALFVALMKMDDKIGADFEQGLADLKRISEAG